MWERITEIYQKYKKPIFVFTFINFFIPELFSTFSKGNDSNSICEGRCVIPISQLDSAFDTYSTIALIVTLICFIWIALLYYSD